MRLLEGREEINVNLLLAGGQGVGKVLDVLAVVGDVGADELEGHDALGDVAVGLRGDDVEDRELVDGAAHGEDVVVAGDEVQVVEVGGADLFAEEEGVEGGVTLGRWLARGWLLAI